MKVKTAILASIMISMSTHVHSADGPSYEETVKFIQSKLVKSYDVTDHNVIVNYVAQFDGCDLTVIYDPKPYGKSIVKKGRKSREFPMRLLDPTTVMPSEDYTQVYANLKDTYEIAVLANIKEPRGSNNKKIRLAFTHLIKLCGGKGELF